MRKLLCLMAVVVILCLWGGVASAATITIDVTPTTPTITADDGNDYSGTIWEAANDKIKIPASLASHKFIITGTSPTMKRHIDIQGLGAGVPASNPITEYNITVKELTLSVQENGGQIVNFSNNGHIAGIVIRYNASVDMKVENYLTIEKHHRGNNTGLIHIGENNDYNNVGRNSLYIHGDGKNETTITLDVDKYVERNGGGCDALRANQFCTLYAKDLTIRGINVPDSNRAFATNNDDGSCTFDECTLELEGGRPIAAYGNPTDLPRHSGPDLHFINSVLKLTGTNNTNSPIYVPDAEIIFCKTSDGSAIIQNTKNDNATIHSQSVIVAGGAVQITNDHSDAGIGIKTNKIDFVVQDKDHHPALGENESLIFYVDKAVDEAGTGSPTVKVEPGIKAIISEPTTPGQPGLQTKAEYTSDPNYTKTGNVWGDFELFNARDDIPDYVIHDKEQIIVQYDPDRPNTIGIRPDAELTIEKGGRLVIEPGPFSNVNDGAIVLKDGTMTKEQIVKMIKDWGFTGTGIIKTPVGTFDNSGAEWGDIVDNTDPAQASKLTGGPNMIVTGKDANGRSVLVAVNPSTKDEAYTVPANQKLDTKLFVTDPADPTHKTLSPMYDGAWTSAVVYPLNADGSVPQDINTATAKIGPMPTVKIESSKAGFSLSVDDIAELRRYAKDNNMDTFVIWVYETNGKDDREYKTGSPIKFPFVFRVDSPEHQLHTIVTENPGAQDRITQGDNLVVLNTVPQAGAVAQQRFVSINPTRADAPHVLPEKNSLALDIYIATEDKNYRVDSNSAKYESKKVKASLRPYDGLTPEQYKSLNDYVITKGPSEIVGGYANFEFDHGELFRWAHRHRLDEFVIYIYDEETNGGLVSREFVFRMSDADTGVGGAHCSGCDALGAPLFALALALSGAALMRRGKR